jgi:endoribonuclease Dicer
MYTGPLKCSKKEAKRAVAFLAVKWLHELDVFDEYLLPTPGKTLGEEEIAQASLALEPRDTPAMVNVDVKYPWAIGERLWLHPLYLRGKPVTGLISGTPLPLVELRSDVLVRLGRPQALALDKEEEMDLREIMHEYTELGIYYRVTGSPLSEPLGLYLVPLSDNFEVDFHQIRRVVDNPRGIASWNDIVYGDEQKLLVLNRYESGRTRVLQKIRNDLSPMTTPPLGSFEATYKRTDSSGTEKIVASSSYHEYWTDRWTRKRKFQIEIPQDGPLLEAPRIEKRASSRYTLDASYRIPIIEPDFKVSSIVPMNTCGWVDMSPDVVRAFEILPALCRKITDAYRAESARLNIGLPFIPNDLLMEALTLPNVDADFSNQRLETLGDAVLDICTTVHLMLKYPMRHEGQLSTLRARVVSNKFLVTCARTVELEKFISSERMSVDKWPFVEQKRYEMKEIRDRKSVRRQIPRRGLQDCVEALLGASFIAGGIPMALKTGVCFGLSFGGTQPWGERCRKAETREIGVPALVAGLEKELGYNFENPELLVEAVTHPSFEFSSTPSYQRLEFLGDCKYVFSS